MLRDLTRAATWPKLNLTDSFAAKPMMIVTEYMDGGSLDSFLKVRKLPNYIQDCSAGLFGPLKSLGNPRDRLNEWFESEGAGGSVLVTSDSEDGLWSSFWNVLQPGNERSFSFPPAENTYRV